MQILSKGKTFLAITCPDCKAYLAVYSEDIKNNPEDKSYYYKCVSCCKKIPINSGDIPKEWKK